MNPTNRPIQCYTDSMLGSMLNSLNDEYMLDAIRSTIRSFQIQPIFIPTPNIVSVYENNFNEALATYPMERDHIYAARTEIYKKIIALICEEYNLGYNIDFESDYYTIAYYLYGIFVTRLQKCLLLFFRDYILNDMPNIISMYRSDPEIEKLARDKALKAKRKADAIVTDSEIGYFILSYRLRDVIYNICGRDIDFNQFLASSLSACLELYDSASKIDIFNLLAQTISAPANFFSSTISRIVTDDKNAHFISSLWIEITSLFNANQNIQIIKTEE